MRIYTLKKDGFFGFGSGKDFLQSFWVLGFLLCFFFPFFLDPEREFGEGKVLKGKSLLGIDKCVA